MSTPTTAELEVLNILWNQGESRVQDVHEQLSQSRATGYTTTLKIMQVMAQKGLLERRLEGRSHLYSPAVPESATKNKLLSKFVDSAFGGSRSQLILQLLGDSQVSPEELDQIKKYLTQVEDR